MEDHVNTTTVPKLPIRIFGVFRSVTTSLVRELLDPNHSVGTERWKRLSLAILLLAVIIAAAPMAWAQAPEPPGSEAFERDRIQPFAGNHHYWQYQGEPLLLIGGTHDDNPFNSPSNDPMGNGEHLDDHLDLLASAGGNYVRNTMTHRDIFNVFPYLREPDLFRDGLDDPGSWTSVVGQHAHDATTGLDGTGSLSIWSDGGGSGRHVLRRDLPPTDIRNGMIEVSLWVRDRAAARKLEHLEVALEASGRSAYRVWPGQIMTGWHVLFFHVDEFEADGFDPSTVDAIELRVGIVNGAALEPGEVAWDGLAVRGRFDLEQPNPEYWRRFGAFLDAAWERGLIVQIELWDKVELYSDGSPESVRWVPRLGWSKHPFNPRNNVNYTAETSGLKEVIDWSFDPGSGSPPRGDRDVETIHPFWYTVPRVAELLPGEARAIRGFELTEDAHQRLMDVVLPHQVAFVDKVLEFSLPYPNVLYAISNETWLPTSDWSDFWATHVRRRASEAGRGIEVGEMRGEHDLREAPPHAHLHVIRSPELYSFIDVSQNNGRKLGDEQWQDLQWLRTELAAAGVRPINNVKIYDFTPRGEPAGRVDFSIQKFWRNILGGAASSRFHRRMGAALHRPYDSNGQPITSESNEPGLASFRSVVMFLDVMDIFRAEPANELLHHRSDHGAYAMAIAGEQYAVYFPAGGSVDLVVVPGSYRARWLDITTGAWLETALHERSEVIQLTAPIEPHALVVLEHVGN